LGSAPLPPDTLAAPAGEDAVRRGFEQLRDDRRAATPRCHGSKRIAVRRVQWGGPGLPLRSGSWMTAGESCPPGVVGEVNHPQSKWTSGVLTRIPRRRPRCGRGGGCTPGDLGYPRRRWLSVHRRPEEGDDHSGGMNIYTDDVEAALQSHPAVVEAAVIGIPHDVLGEDVEAYVRSVRPGEIVTSDELTRFAAEQLADLQGASPHRLPRRASEKLSGGKVGEVPACSARRASSRHRPG